MAENKNSAIFDEADKYRNYFKEDENALQSVVDRLTKLQGISDSQIEAIAGAQQGRGTQHYLVEHITNAIAIQSQMQSVLKDKRSIKERALEIALKVSNGEDIGDGAAVLASLQSLIKEQKKNAEKRAANLENKVESVEENTLSEEEIDAEIERKIKEG